MAERRKRREKLDALDHVGLADRIGADEDGERTQPVEFERPVVPEVCLLYTSHLVGDLGHHDAALAVLLFLHLALGAHRERAAARLVRVQDADVYKRQVTFRQARATCLRRGRGLPGGASLPGRR